jgi:hypothetical protein
LILVAEQDFLQVFFKRKGVTSVGKSYGHLPTSIIVTSKYRLSFSLPLFAGYQWLLSFFAPLITYGCCV